MARTVSDGGRACVATVMAGLQVAQSGEEDIGGVVQHQQQEVQLLGKAARSKLQLLLQEQPEQTHRPQNHKNNNNNNNDKFV